MKFKALIFDFDGVLVESVKIKLDAFNRLFEHCNNDIRKKVDEYNTKCGSVSRYKKIKYCYEHFLEENLTEDELQIIAQRYTMLTIEGVIEAPCVIGAKEFLDRYHDKIDLYVITATPQKDIDIIMEKRNMKKYFKEVYGTRYSKEESIKKIVKDKSYQYNDIAYIGDSLTDLIDAKNAGVKFIGRNRDNRKLFNIEFIVDNLIELGDKIE